MSKEIQESVRRELTATVSVVDGSLVLKTTGYGERVDLHDLLKGLNGRIVTVTVEAKP